MTKNTAHANCTHPATKAERAKCRRARRVEQAPAQLFFVVVSGQLRYDGTRPVTSLTRYGNETDMLSALNTLGIVTDDLSGVREMSERVVKWGKSRER